MRGGSIFGIYPFNHYNRVEVSAGILQYNEAYTDQFVDQTAAAYQEQRYGSSQLFRNGTSMPLGVSFIQETTVFREYGPLVRQHDAHGLRRLAEGGEVPLEPDGGRRCPLLRAAR